MGSKNYPRTANRAAYRGCQKPLRWSPTPVKLAISAKMHFWPFWEHFAKCIGPVAMPVKGVDARTAAEMNLTYGNFEKLTDPSWQDSPRGGKKGFSKNPQIRFWYPSPPAPNIVPPPHHISSPPAPTDLEVGVLAIQGMPKKIIVFFLVYALYETNLWW